MAYFEKTINLRLSNFLYFPKQNLSTLVYAGKIHHHTVLLQWLSSGQFYNHSKPLANFDNT